ncbi:pimeloyl-ACP methyl ester carboxylesterase [Flavobacteriaceae bacterium MAR_2010_72]|nr:pimeloyl-ACP methyl ester carboxylesterase [Flavobacteriaceae bacterium MAR_2010_72]
MIVNYKNTPVFYKECGQGQAVVLLHGFLEHSGIWSDLAKTLSKKYRVVCIDLLGHGNTGCIGYIHTMEDMANTVHFVLNHLNIQKCTMVGHSMGGYVALAYAELFPNVLNGLCLMNSTALNDSIEKQKSRDRAIAAVKQNHKSFIRIAISNLFRPKNRKRFSQQIQILKEEALKMSLQGIIAALEGMKIRKNRVQLFQSLPFKKMLILGRKDPVLEYDTLIEQTKNSNIELAEFEDGHMSYIENKEEITYKIMYFIEK